MFLDQHSPFLLRAIALSCLIAFTGCYVTKGQVPPVREIQAATIPAKVNLSINLTHTLEGEESTGQNNQQRIDTVKKISQDTLQKSNLFQTIEYQLFAADLNLELNVTEKEKGTSGQAILSGLTLTIFPVKTGAYFEVTANLKDKNKNLIGTYSSKGDFNVLIQLLLIIPIGWRFSIPDQVYAAIFKDIASQIAADRNKILNALKTVS